MLQVKTPVEGRDAGGPQGTYWMSPQRDIAMNFPVFVEKALAFCVELKTNAKVKQYYDVYGEEEGVKHFEDLAKRLVAFVRETTQTPDIKVNDAYKTAGFEEANQDAYELYCYAFTCVTMSAYFFGAREAAQGSFNPYILSDLRKIVKND